MKKTISLIAALCLSFLSNIEAKTEGDYALQIFLADNSTVLCEFSKQPQMTLNEGIMTLTTTDSTIGSWEFSEVRKWNFVDAEKVAIKDVKEQKPLITIQENTIMVSCPQKEKALIYDISGKLYSSATILGGTRIPLNTMASGVYLLKVGNHSLKFTVK